MRIKRPVSISWIAAAALALALPVTQSAWAVASSSASKLLSSELPAGLTLKKASVDQVADAVYTAASQRPDLVMRLLETAILAKQPPPHNGYLPCPDLFKLLKKAVGAVPDKARELLELAMSLDPDCTDSLEKALDDPTLLGLSAGAFGNGLTSGFGAGLGTDFPGSPGFTGSPPGGATALPPTVVPPVTSDTAG
jgi:hypothetical protein